MTIYCMYNHKLHMYTNYAIYICMYVCTQCLHAQLVAQLFYMQLLTCFQKLCDFLMNRKKTINSSRSVKRRKRAINVIMIIACVCMCFVHISSYYCCINLLHFPRLLEKCPLIYQIYIRERVLKRAALMTVLNLKILSN